MVTKLGMVVTCSKEVSFINLHYPSIRWFCEVTWKVKYFMFQLSLDQWSPNMARWWLTIRVSHPWPMWGHVTIWKIYMSTLQNLQPLNLAGCSLREGGSARKRLSCKRLSVSFLFFEHFLRRLILQLFVRIIFSQNPWYFQLMIFSW